jgi:hypothetical protein
VDKLAFDFSDIFSKGYVRNEKLSAPNSPPLALSAWHSQNPAIDLREEIEFVPLKSAWTGARGSAAPKSP